MKDMLYKSKHRRDTRKVLHQYMEMVARKQEVFMEDISPSFSYELTDI